MFIRNSKHIEVTCRDPTYTPQCGYNIDDGGWTLVRHVPNGTTWHTSTDKLAGTDTYGSPSEGPESSSAWSVDFESAVSNFDEFLITSGNCKHWMIANKQKLLGEGNFKIH